MKRSNGWIEMNSQTIAAALATIIGLAVAAYAFAYVSVGDTYKSERQVERIGAESPSYSGAGC
jgi:hypothetical protein